MSPVYLVALIKIEDPESYEAYATGFDWDHLKSLGGECLIVSDDPEVLEGEWNHGRLVMLRFPSRDSLRVWYESEEYGKVRGIRWKHAVSDFSIHQEARF